MRYFCGKGDTSVASDTSDTSNTAYSNDACDTSESVIDVFWISSESNHSSFNKFVGEFLTWVDYDQTWFR